MLGVREPVDRTATVAGYRLHYVEAGRGQPVLLIHGIPTWSLLWQGVATHLAPRFRVLAPDLLNYGHSEQTEQADVSIGAQAGYLVALLDDLRIQQAHVVGHDIGGGVVQLLAVRFAERVASLTLIDSVCYDAWPVLGARLMQLGAPVVARVPSSLVLAAMKLDLRRGFARNPEGGMLLDRFLRPFAGRTGLRALVHNVRALDNTATQGIADDLRRLLIPTLVVWGQEDVFLKPSYATRLAGDIPGAELHLLASVGHYAPADAPNEVGPLLVDFLSRGNG